MVLAAIVCQLAPPLNNLDHGCCPPTPPNNSDLRTALTETLFLLPIAFYWTLNVSNAFVESLNTDGSASAVARQLQDPICKDIAGCTVTIRSFSFGLQFSTTINGQTSIADGTDQANATLTKNVEALINTDIEIKSLNTNKTVSLSVTAASVSSESIYISISKFLPVHPYVFVVLFRTIPSHFKFL